MYIFFNLKMRAIQMWKLRRLSSASSRGNVRPVVWQFSTQCCNSDLCVLLLRLMCIVTQTSMYCYSDFSVLLLRILCIVTQTSVYCCSDSCVLLLRLLRIVTQTFVYCYSDFCVLIYCYSDFCVLPYSRMTMTARSLADWSLPVV